MYAGRREKIHPFVYHHDKKSHVDKVVVLCSDIHHTIKCGFLRHHVNSTYLLS